MWRSNSLTVLALAAGVLSPCAMPPSARAGDKIEFSAPRASLKVPQVVREDKEPPKSEMPRSIQAEDMVPRDMEGASEIVIVSTPEEKDVKTRDSAFTDYLDDNANADSRYDILESRQRPINGATNAWSMPEGWNPDAGSLVSERRNDEAASRDHLRGLLEAASTAGRIDYQNDGLYGRHSSNWDGDSAGSLGLFRYGSPPEETVAQKLSKWPGSFLHRGLPDSHGAQDESMPTYAQMQAIKEQLGHGNSSARFSSAADDQPRSSSLSVNPPGYTWQTDALHDRTPDERMSAPRAFYPVETKIVSQNPDIFERQRPPASPPGQVQSPPAILPFPKKPGSVLQ